MSDEGTITIMFRGLMVGHLVTQEGGESFYEIGIMHAKGHHLRIHTMVGDPHNMEKAGEPVGVLHLDKFTGESQPRRWELKADAPAAEGVRLKENAKEPPDRISSTDKDDFRWIIDLDSGDFYPGVTAPGVVSLLDTARLKPLVRINHGEFYTSETARVLRRKASDPKFTVFGRVAGNTACEIKVKGGGVHLVDERGDVLFSARSAPGIFYEFVNTPPEPLGRSTLHHHHPPQDHFQFYYDLFTGDVADRLEKFHFQEPKPPGSRPHLCGKIYLSESNDPFK